jgi:predicted RNA-binding protein with PUA-like domain
MSTSSKYWLMKSEPEAYSIDDLKRDKKTAWTGVRNYQARNFMAKSMRIGDLVIFYHSNADPSGAVGLAKVASAAHPDQSAGKEKHVWSCVDVTFVKKFSQIIALSTLRANRKLAKMVLLKKGSRLSVQPVTESEFNEIIKMAQ